MTNFLSTCSILLFSFSHEHFYCFSFNHNILKFLSTKLQHNILIGFLSNTSKLIVCLSFHSLFFFQTLGILIVFLLPHKYSIFIVFLSVTRVSVVFLSKPFNVVKCLALYRLFDCSRQCWTGRNSRKLWTRTLWILQGMLCSVLKT